MDEKYNNTIKRQGEMRVLLAWLGATDLGAAKSDSQELGPILQAALKRNFDCI